MDGQNLFYRTLPTEAEGPIIEIESKIIFKIFLQNSLPEQAKVAEKGADSMERAVQVKMQPAWWDSFENDKFHLQENFWLHGAEPAYIHHPQPAW